MKIDHILIKLNSLVSDGLLVKIDDFYFRTMHGNLLKIAGPYLNVEFGNVWNENSYINCYFDDIYNIDYNGNAIIIYNKYQEILLFII